MFWQSVEDLENEKITQKKNKSQTEGGAVSLFQTIEPEGFNALASQGQWQEVEFAVDSGASETVVNEEMLPDVEVK